MIKENAAVSEALDKANDFIRQNISSVKGRYRPSYHLAPQIGWMNDPNGFSYFGGRLHLFYQYNPYNTFWEPMHWGHAVTHDLIRWDYLPVALAPDTEYDRAFGCFSGSAIEKDKALYLIYTGVDGEGVQTQNIARSTDGISFEKQRQNPVMRACADSMGISEKDFRDPYVFRCGDSYYALVGTKTGESGNLVLFRSDDLQAWSFVGQVFDTSNADAPNAFSVKGVCECPAFAEIDGTQVLIFSPQFLPQQGNMFQNVHSVVYATGELDLETGSFSHGALQEVDGGFDFYAAQTLALPDGRCVMIAWMQMWDRSYPTKADGWVGSMCLPRELSVKGGRLYQAPVREIEKYRTDRRTRDRIHLVGGSEVCVTEFSGTCSELCFTLRQGTAERAGVKLFKGKQNETAVYYDASAGTVVVDRSKSGIAITGAEENQRTRSVHVSDGEGAIRFRIFLDNTSIEVFVNDGEAVLSSNVYAEEGDVGVAFFSEGGSAEVTDAERYTIKI